MSFVLDFKESCPSISLKSRPTRVGPEWNLVQDFSEYIVELFKTRNNKLAIFYEPLLESGFPDIVVAEFSERVFDNWNEARTQLKPKDFKILNHIYTERGATIDCLASKLGYKQKDIEKVIQRLYEASLLKITKTNICPKKHSSVFGIKKLIAFEAKMNDWQTVFQQALTNKWFASEVYVLSPVSTPALKTIQYAEKNGIGIYTFNGIVNKVCLAEQRPIPSCYATWLFNEWIGRRLNQNCDYVSYRCTTANPAATKTIKP